MKLTAHNMHNTLCCIVCVLSMGCGILYADQSTTGGDSGTIVRKLGTYEDGGHVYEVILWVQEHADTKRMIERKGRLVTYDNAQATVVISHGFMCDKFDVGFIRSIFPKNVNSLTFDFRAHGENTRCQCCTFGRDEAYEVIAAAQFLKTISACANTPLIAYGFSMGAVASIEAQAKTSLFDALILDCPFDSSERVIKKSLDRITFSLFGYRFQIPGRHVLERYAFHPYVQSFIKEMLKAVSQLDSRNIELMVYPFTPRESVQKITIPCFFIHCKHDEKIDVSSIKNMYARAAGPKKLWITNGRHHFDSYFYNPEKYRSQVRHFVNDIVCGFWRDKAKQQVIEDADDVAVI